MKNTLISFIKKVLLSIMVSCILSFIQAPAFAQNTVRPLTDKLFFTVDELKTMISPATEWKPFPSLAGPEATALIPQAVRNAYIKKGEELISVGWDPLPASVFLQYTENGDRTRYETLSFRRRENLANLALAEAFEGKGRFIKPVIDGIWALCEETFWGVPAHLSLQKAGPGLPDWTDPVVDLFAAETGSEMAWVYYLLKTQLDRINPLIAKRIKQEVNRRILRPFLENNTWGYLGYSWRANPDSVRRVNNWNPWINSNVLPAALILGDEELRIPVIHKTLNTLNNFILPYPEDGSSDEGPQYWDRAAGALAEYLEWLGMATGGKARYNDPEQLYKMGQYFCAMYIHNDYYVNYGDADAKLYPDPALLFRFGKDTGNDTLMRFASFVARRSGYGKSILPGIFGMLNRVVPALFTVNDLLATAPQEPFIRDAWMPDTELMMARSKAGTEKGWHLIAKGGNNGVSHNHNDIGNFCVYADGRPVLIDAGALNYTKATFSSKRYEIWNNRSSYHNVPSINGFEQKEGAAFRAKNIRYFNNDDEAGLELDIAPAYPTEAGILFWRRKTTLQRQGSVTIRENYFLAGYRKPFTENLLTSCVPEFITPGRITLTDTGSGKQYSLIYNEELLHAQLDTIYIHDRSVVTVPSSEPVIEEKGRMETIWGPAIYRIRLESRKKSVRGNFSLTLSALE